MADLRARQTAPVLQKKCQKCHLIYLLTPPIQSLIFFLFNDRNRTLYDTYFKSLSRHCSISGTTFPSFPSRCCSSYLAALMDVWPSLSLTKCGNGLRTPSLIRRDLCLLVCSLSTTVCKVIPLFLVGFSWSFLQIQVLYSYKVVLSYNLQPKCPTIIYMYMYAHYHYSYSPPGGALGWIISLIIYH